MKYGGIKRSSFRRVIPLSFSVVGICLLPIVWFSIKRAFSISDDYLPDPILVVMDLFSRSGFYLYQALFSLGRLLIGSTLGISLGLFLGLGLYNFDGIRKIILPSLQSMRAIPSPAMIPFFLLWFGFSETGKIVLVSLGISLNLTIAVLQAFSEIPYRYHVAFRSYYYPSKKFPLSFLLPYAVSRLLPTLRFSVSVSIGLVVISEYLGAQSGLGYIMENAQTTYNLVSMTSCAILFGLIAIGFDSLLVHLWKLAVPWEAKHAKKEN